ncbi:MAG TPA: NACHT domain-containing protein [Archangium sp.]|nr:NACHT domain-containing protein [Archangium sp.]
MSDTSAELSRIASTLELTDGLALILVLGPDFRAPEGLSLIRSGLPGSRPTLWHRLDCDGPDVVSAVERAQVDEPIVLVHGLENLEQDDRAATESSLNMLRDRLMLIRAAVILWVPRSDLEAFQRHCADLFSWRSLLVSFSEEQVPTEPDLEAQRIYLFRLRNVLKGRIAGHLVPLPPVQPELLSDRRVRPQGGRGDVCLHDWVRTTQHGILLGTFGSGKTTALMALALLWAREAADTPPGAPCPLFVTARDLYQGPAFGLDLDDDELPATPFPGARFPPGPRFAAWARSGELVLMLDGLDELEGLARELCADWLERLRKRYPRLRITVTSRTRVPELRSSWTLARLNPLSFADLRAQMADLLTQAPQKPTLQSVRESLKTLEDSKTDTRHFPANLFIQFVAKTADLGMAASLLAGSTLTASDASRFGSMLSNIINWWFIHAGPELLSIRQFTPRALRWLLAALAFRGIERGTAEILDEDISHALASLQQEAGDSLPLPASPAQALLLLHDASRYLPWIIAETGSRRFRFAHPVFQTFFAADWVEHKEPGTAARLMAPVLQQPRWRAVAVMAAWQFAIIRGPSEAHEFIAEFLRIPAAPGVEQLRLMALALECTMATNLPAQDTSEWRAQAEQLCRTATRSEEEETARKELFDALERLRNRQRST